MARHRARHRLALHVAVADPQLETPRTKRRKDKWYRCTRRRVGRCSSQIDAWSAWPLMAAPSPPQGALRMRAPMMASAAGELRVLRPASAPLPEYDVAASGGHDVPSSDPAFALLATQLASGLGTSRSRPGRAAASAPRQHRDVARVTAAGIDAAHPGTVRSQASGRSHSSQPRTWPERQSWPRARWPSPGCARPAQQAQPARNHRSRTANTAARLEDHGFASLAARRLTSRFVQLHSHPDAKRRPGPRSAGCARAVVHRSGPRSRRRSRTRRSAGSAPSAASAGRRTSRSWRALSVTNPSRPATSGLVAAKRL